MTVHPRPKPNMHMGRSDGSSMFCDVFKLAQALVLVWLSLRIGSISHGWIESLHNRHSRSHGLENTCTEGHRGVFGPVRDTAYAQNNRQAQHPTVRRTSPDHFGHCSSSQPPHPQPELVRDARVHDSTFFLFWPQSMTPLPR